MHTKDLECQESLLGSSYKHNPFLPGVCVQRQGLGQWSQCDPWGQVSGLLLTRLICVQSVAGGKEGFTCEGEKSFYLGSYSIIVDFPFFHVSSLMTVHKQILPSWIL